MKIMLAAMALMLATPSLAADCPLTEAVYGQPGNDWTMRFTPVPRDGAANQIAAFSIAMPGAPETRFDGGIYIPNGFGQAFGVVSLAAETGNEAEDEPASEAGPFWEGVVYALVDGGIAELPHEPGQPAPQQVLLPQFASSIWYSMLRETAFADESGVLDTFVLQACAK